MAQNSSESREEVVTVPASDASTAVLFSCVDADRLGWKVAKPDGTVIASSWGTCDGTSERNTALLPSTRSQRVEVSIEGDFGATTKAALVVVPDE
ncbi:hypothetical protein QT381_09735 [Galbitalea sp. SE-J8]|uniref:hypothetical protein n=1 Tax=Galbitalea sp. SE-J8 TaxID=3054952 RepID=UPI00259CC27B|nr:hypothetical protein [Galbitalea sp. SE-J8]MDM4763286.1 hypothetical protein [Galbitalea sp. SE-J8]